MATTAFVVPSGRGTTFGLCTRSFSAVFSEATDNAAVSDAVPSAEVPKASAEEKFTIYVSNVPFGKLHQFDFVFCLLCSPANRKSVVDDKEVAEFFGKAGTVKDISIPRRKDSTDSRGFAFVEMASREEMERAVEQLDGSDFGGRAIQARVSLPKDKLPTKSSREKPAKRARGPDGPKVYVGNLPYGVAENDLKELFSEHGEVVSVFLVKDDDGQDRGFGFVTMGSEEAVDAAVSKIDGSFFQGRRLAARRPLAEGAKAEPTPPRK